MQFSINLFNHCAIGQRSLEDVVGIIGHQLNALGHRACWNRDNNKWVTGDNGYNVVVEGFTPPVVEAIAEGHAGGARFICLATEEPTDKGFNHGIDPEMVMRQKTFITSAPYLDGILHLVPGERVTKWYSQFAPAAHAELGYSPTLMRQTAQVPDYEFGFFGSMSKRRERILKKIAKMTHKEKAVRIVSDFATQLDRDNAMRQAKVILQIRKEDAMGLVSSSRCNTSLSIGRPIVAEPHDLCKPWDEVIHFSKSEDQFFRDAFMMAGLWQANHVSQLAKFKAKFTPDFCIGNPLRKIGILEAERVCA